MAGRLLEIAAGAAQRATIAADPRSEPRAQAAGLAERAHRPWPPPAQPWLHGQTWRDLLFAHRRLPVEALRPAVPDELPIDTHDGSAWLGITPFEVTGLRLRGMPPVPRLSRFPETNVRTYTTIGGRPGIHFLSLDAGSALAVAGARRAFRLPYFRAHMAIERAGGEIRHRTRRPDPPAVLHVRYRPSGGVFQARPGTLEHFLTERYCLYTLDERRRVLRADIHHPPWPLQEVTAELEDTTMTAPYGLELSGATPLLHFAARQDVVVWPPAAASPS